MKKKIIPLLVGMVCLFARCGQTPSPSANYMILDEVKYVEVFPKSFSLDNETPAISDAMGAQSFAIFDSLLFVQTSDPDGFWYIYSLPGDRLLGKFLRKGNGPSEFLTPPAMNHVRFYRDAGTIFAELFDFNKKRLVVMDVIGLIERGYPELTELSGKMPRWAINSIRLDDNTFFGRELDNSASRLNRFLMKDNKEIVRGNLAKLNKAHVNFGEDHNILAADIKYNAEKDLILETPTMLNYINLYSPKGAEGKTICVGKKLDNIKKIQDIDPADRMYTYDGARIYSDFFAALYCNEDVKTYETERKMMPVIQLFDWAGEPVAELKLNKICTSFDFDLLNGYLYIFDRPSEMFYKYIIQH